MLSSTGNDNLSSTRVYYKAATATDAGEAIDITFPGPGTFSAAIYKTNKPITEIDVPFALGTDNPPSIAFVSQAVTAMIAAATTERSTYTAQAAPTGYSVLRNMKTDETGSTSGGHCTTALAQLVANVASMDPGVFNWGSGIRNDTAISIYAR